MQTAVITTANNPPIPLKLLHRPNLPPQKHPHLALHPLPNLTTPNHPLNQITPKQTHSNIVFENLLFVCLLFEKVWLGNQCWDTLGFAQSD
jgi:hypothetical protein